MKTKHCLVIAFRRPDETKQLLDILANRPEIKVDVFVDRPSTEADEDARSQVVEIASSSRASIINIDEPRDPLGCGGAVATAVSSFLARHGQGLILEDDLLPSDPFFDFGFWALDEFARSNALMVSGRNEFPTAAAMNRGYEITTGGIWGWGTWGWAWDKYDHQIKAPEKLEMSKLSSWLMENDPLTWHFLIAGISLVDAKKIDTWDFQWAISRLQNNGVSINAPLNLVENRGHTSKSTHNLLRSRDKFRSSDSIPRLEKNLEIDKNNLWPSLDYIKRPRALGESLVKYATVARGHYFAKRK